MSLPFVLHSLFNIKNTYFKLYHNYKLNYIENSINEPFDALFFWMERLLLQSMCLEYITKLQGYYRTCCKPNRQSEGRDTCYFHAFRPAAQVTNTKAMKSQTKPSQITAQTRNNSYCYAHIPCVHNHALKFTFKNSKFKT